MSENDPTTTPSDRAGGSAPEGDGTERHTAEDRGGRRTPFTQQLGRIVVIAIAVLFGIFAVFNAHPVTFNWVFGETEVVESGGEHLRGGVPLIVLLVTSFALGAIVGRLSTWRRDRARRRADRQED